MRLNTTLVGALLGMATMTWAARPLLCSRLPSQSPGTGVWRGGYAVCSGQFSPAMRSPRGVGKKHRIHAVTGKGGGVRRIVGVDDPGPEAVALPPCPCAIGHRRGQIHRRQGGNFSAGASPERELPSPTW